MDSKARLPETDTNDHDRKVTDMLRTNTGASRRRSGWGRAAGMAGGALAVLLMVVWTGCKNPLKVENPNKLTSDNVTSPAAYGALVGGARNNLARAADGMLAIMNNATDQSFWIGSRDAWGSLDKGHIADPTNEFTDVTWPYVGQARYMADLAIQTGEQFNSDGTLPSKDDLARAYLYGGTLYTLIADTWQRYVLPSNLTDPTTPGSPIASANMPKLYDTAIGYFNKGLAVVQDADIKAELTAMKARAEQGKQIRLQIESGNPTANGGVVASPQAAADAQTALSMAAVTDEWTFQLEFDSGLLGISCESWGPQVWSRGELQVGDQPAPNNAYVYLSNSDKTVDSVKIKDPIDGIIDPEFSTQLKDFEAGGRNAPITEVSARELHLIIAENALANGDMTTFATQINHVRSLDGLSDWTTGSAIAANKILEYERNVNLMWQGRRLADLYRFGDKDPLWLPNSDAITSPGSLFPITITEIRSNPNVSG